MRRLVSVGCRPWPSSHSCRTVTVPFVSGWRPAERRTGGKAGSRAFGTKRQATGTLAFWGPSSVSVPWQENESSARNLSKGSGSARRSFYSAASSETSLPELHITVEKERCRFPLPIPHEGQETDRIFTLSFDTTVQQIVEMVKDEDKSLKSVEFFRGGDQIPPTTELQDLLRSPFVLMVNGQPFLVHPPPYLGGAYVSLEADSEPDVRLLAQKSAIIRVRKLLEADPRSKMRYKEFLDLCQANGVPEAQARELSRCLHSAGLVLHFHGVKDELLRNTIFLKPEEVIDRLFKDMGLTSPTEHLARDEAARKQQHLKELELELNPMLAHQTHLDNIARQKATRLMWGMVGGLFSLGGVYWYLTFIYFSWDIMEPVTYFTGASLSLLSCVWWTLTNREYEYENIYDYAFRRAQEREYQRSGLDQEKIDELKKEVEQCQREIDTLRLKKHHPAIVAAYLSRKGFGIL